MADSSSKRQSRKNEHDSVTSIKSRSRPISAADYLPARLSLRSLRRAEEVCQGCELYKRATQVVGGEGSAHAKMILVGEAPGDLEDQMGRPFVGPAGKLLDTALNNAGIPKEKVFVTNAVKHFSWEPMGKRRLHAKPKAREIAACRPWLEAEIEVIKPKLIVCLGATAAQTLLGKDFRVSQQRGQIIDGRGVKFLATYHPSAILRTPDPTQRRQMQLILTEDLRTAANHLE